MEIKEEKNRMVLLTDDGQEAGEMTWSQAGEDLIIIDHTFVDDAYRGHQYAQQLVAAGVEMAREKNLKVLPLCPFAKKEFAEKPEYGDVLRK